MHIRTTVDERLSTGESVDVIVGQILVSERRSIVDILGEAPGHLLFTSATGRGGLLGGSEGCMGPLMERVTCA